MLAFGMQIAYSKGMMNFQNARSIVLDRYKLNAAEANFTTKDLLDNAERLGYRIRTESDFVNMLDDLERLGS